MKIVRKELTPDEISNPSQRYNADCNCVQWTGDGGTTWVDAPQFDPRTSPAMQVPAFAFDDPRCDAATSLVDNFHSGLDGTLNAISATTTAVGGASFILNFLDFLDGIGLLVQLIVDFCALVIAIGVSVVEAGFTDAVYADLICRVSCNTQPDGTWTQANLNAIEASVRDFYGDTNEVTLIFNGWLENLGPVGMSNVASIKHTMGDCSDCALCCPENSFDFTSSEQGFALTAWTGDAGSYPAVGIYTALGAPYGTGWFNQSSGGINYMSISKLDLDCVQANKIRVKGYADNGITIEVQLRKHSDNSELSDFQYFQTGAGGFDFDGDITAVEESGVDVYMAFTAPFGTTAGFNIVELFQG